MSESKLLSYLTNRIKHESYRGVHLAQHNRLPEDKLVKLLTVIHQVVGKDEFLIPPGDDPNPSREHVPRSVRESSRFAVYFRILDEISQQSGITATFNSLKKNHFPNFDGMGLLQRRAVAEGTVARLTSAGIQLLGAKTPRQRSLLIGQATERLIGEEFLEEIDVVLAELDMLNVYELMLFVTDQAITTQEKIDLVRKYRRLRAVSKIHLHATIKDQCASTMSLPKKEKRDWHNWWNESKQILTMMSHVQGFNVYHMEHIMRAGSPGVALFDPVRSTTIKRLALDWHGITPINGWELHHIYPVQYATCEKDMTLIDSKENLIYIPATEHRKIPRNDNLAVKLTYTEDKVILSNPLDRAETPLFEFQIPKSIRVNVENLESMRQFNQDLLSTIS